MKRQVQVTVDDEPATSVCGEYAGHLALLDSLDAAGLGDSPGADVLRDRMTGLWYRMSSAEQDRFRSGEWSADPPDEPLTVEPPP